MNSEVALAIIAVVSSIVGCGIWMIKSLQKQNEINEKANREANERADDKYRALTETYIGVLKEHGNEALRRNEEHRKDMQDLTHAMKEQGVETTQALREIADSMRLTNGTLEIVVRDVDEMKKLVKPKRVPKAKVG